MSQPNDPSSVVLPTTDPVSVPTDPTNDKLYALITAAITAVATAITAFLPITGEQKAAILAAVVPSGSLFAYIFISSHHANVQAQATKAAQVMASRLAILRR